MIPLSREERDLIEALRELTPIRKLGIYSSTITQLLAQKNETRSNKSKKEILDKAVKTLSKAIHNS